ncbi:MAG: hypothetical protein PHH49_03840 [Candidatus Omnitrophica bacterium]|nr:hypothetical protein [Candidatus Omnitrophota bacterium]MDD5488081.1 hypothetical protein [Candidatus Omnitrophota bacterium]
MSTDRTETITVVLIGMGVIFAGLVLFDLDIMLQNTLMFAAFICFLAGFMFSQLKKEK